MTRGQASVEYCAVVMALVLGVCLLVRYATPVQEIGRELVQAILPDRLARVQQEPRRRRAGPSKPRPATPLPCYCPLDADPGRSSEIGGE